MDTSSVVAGIEAALSAQLTLAGDDAAVAAAARALQAALRPAVHRAALELAEQAAVEVRAQLPEHQVDIVMREGEPAVVVRVREGEARFAAEDLEARLTLRLPEALKRELEQAAGAAGDSINSFVVKALSTRRSTVDRRGRRITATFDT